MGAVTACAVTPDGRRIILASRDRKLKVWDLESGRVLATLDGHADRVTSCVQVADGRRVVSGSDDRTLKVWDLESGRVLATLDGHAGSVHACAVTPDGRHAVSASEDRTVKVWDLDTYACLFTHRGTAAYFAVAATATTIVAGDVAGDVWVLDLPLACPRVRAEVIAHIREQLGEEPWGRIAEAIHDALERGEARELTLPDLVAFAEQRGFAWEDVHVVVEKLAQGPASLLQRIFLSPHESPPVVVPVQEVVRRLRDGLEDDAAWQRWASDIKVLWRLRSRRTSPGKGTS
jgi:hypothetical protein